MMNNFHGFTSFREWFDLKRAMKLDEELTGNHKIEHRAFLAFFFFLGGGVLSRWLGFRGPSAVCFVFTGLILTLIIIYKEYMRNYLRRIYKKGLATPAIITETEPLTVYALGNLDYSGESRIYGLRRFELEKIPGHQIRSGERIPCAAMFNGSIERSQYQSFSIHPYCWATEQKKVLEEKIRQIDRKEWELLKQAYIKYGDLERLEILELKPDGTPVRRRYDTVESVSLCRLKALYRNRRSGRK